MPTSFTNCLRTHANRFFQAICISYQRGTSLHWLQLVMLQSLFHWYFWCIRNLAILQISLYATVLLWSSHFYSTATQILGWPVMAHFRYFYSAAVQTPLRLFNFTDGLVSWVLMGFPRPSLIHVRNSVIPPFFQYPCSRPQLHAVYRHVVIFQCHFFSKLFTVVSSFGSGIIPYLPCKLKTLRSDFYFLLSIVHVVSLVIDKHAGLWYNISMSVGRFTPIQWIYFSLMWIFCTSGCTATLVWSCLSQNWNFVSLFTVVFSS